MGRCLAAVVMRVCRGGVRVTVVFVAGEVAVGVGTSAVSVVVGVRVGGGGGRGRGVSSLISLIQAVEQEAI